MLTPFVAFVHIYGKGVLGPSPLLRNRLERPPAPKFLLPSPQQLSPCHIGTPQLQLDPKVGDGGSPIVYKVFFIPTDATKAAKYMGEKMVDINDEVCFSESRILHRRLLPLLHPQFLKAFGN